MNPEDKRRRVTMKLKRPNPLFEDWLTDWRDKAKENESKMQHCFSLALNALKKYPLPLETGKDCKILYGFGEKLCKMLDDKLKKYKTEHNGDIATTSNNFIEEPKIKKRRKEKNVSPAKPATTTTPSKDYIPKFGSGPFAILVTLYEKSLETNYPGFLTKNEIIINGQKLSEKSFTKSEPGSRYTAWSSMKTVLEKKLASKQGNPAKFSLTEEGASLAEKLYIQQKIEEFQKQEQTLTSEPKSETAFINSQSLDLGKNKPDNLINVDNNLKKDNKNRVIARHASSSSATSSQSILNNETVILAPNSFEIILLVDTQEVNGAKTNPDNDPLLIELRKLNVVHEVRNLKIGDYLWICRDNSSDAELVLPYIIERKRMDDFGGSIKDGRFHEQKFRLKQSGLQNPIYLVENYGKNEHVGLPISTLYQAATNTLVQEGFDVKYTDNLKGTSEYLAAMANLITKLFKSKTVVGCAKEHLTEKIALDDELVSLMSFKEFNKFSSKNKPFKIRDMFVRQLLQIKGISVEKALAIVEKYPTPKILKNAYHNLEPTQAEKLLANVQFGNTRKNVGQILSKTIHQLFSNKSF